MVLGVWFQFPDSYIMSLRWYRGLIPGCVERRHGVSNWVSSSLSSRRLLLWGCQWMTLAGTVSHTCIAFIIELKPLHWWWWNSERETATTSCPAFQHSDKLMHPKSSAGLSKRGAQLGSLWWDTKSCFAESKREREREREKFWCLDVNFQKKLNLSFFLRFIYFYPAFRQTFIYFFNKKNKCASSPWARGPRKRGIRLRHIGPIGLRPALLTVQFTSSHEGFKHITFKFH